MWRILFSFMFAFFTCDIDENLHILLSVWFLAAVISKIFINDYKLNKVVEFILYDERMKKFEYYYRCIILIIAMTMPSSLVVVVGVYESAKGTPTQTIVLSFLTFYFSIIYFMNKRKYKVPFCNSVAFSSNKDTKK